VHWLAIFLVSALQPTCQPVLEVPKATAPSFTADKVAQVCTQQLWKAQPFHYCLESAAEQRHFQRVFCYLTCLVSSLHTATLHRPLARLQVPKAGVELHIQASAMTPYEMVSLVPLLFMGKSGRLFTSTFVGFLPCHIPQLVGAFQSSSLILSRWWAFPN